MPEGLRRTSVDYGTNGKVKFRQVLGDAANDKLGVIDNLQHVLRSEDGNFQRNGLNESL